jgi:hypothetical protein
MIRLVCVVALAWPLAACVGPRVIGATPETPLWLQERIDEIEVSQAGYPSLDDVPPYSATGRSYEEWEKGVASMEALREEVLTDPALNDPDRGMDVVESLRQARASAEADIERQLTED